MLIVVKDDGQWIVENRAGFIERNVMLRDVRSGLVRVPKSKIRAAVADSLAERLRFSRWRPSTVAFRTDLIRHSVAIDGSVFRGG